MVTPKCPIPVIGRDILSLHRATLRFKSLVTWVLVARDPVSLTVGANVSAWS